MISKNLRQLGRSGVWVTQLGLGGAGLGGMYTAVDPNTAIETVEAAYESGVRYYDTAPMYGHGSSEERLGIALEQLGRQNVVLSTKVGRLLIEQGSAQVQTDIFVGANALQPVFDFTYEGTMRSVEKSLERLNVDTIDILLIHDPDEGLTTDGGLSGADHFAEAMTVVFSALMELRARGVVKAIGVGMNQSEMLYDFALTGKFDCFLLAGRYTLLDQSALQRLLPLCESRGIGVILGGPYNSGILASGSIPGAYYNYRPATPEVLERTRRIEAICNRHEVSLQAAALQFPIAHPAVATVIVGARSPSEARANAGFFAEAIPDAFWHDLKEANLIPDSAPTPSLSADS